MQDILDRDATQAKIFLILPQNYNEYSTRFLSCKVYKLTLFLKDFFLYGFEKVRVF